MNIRCCILVLGITALGGSNAFAQYPIAWSSYKDLGRYGNEQAWDIANAAGGGFYTTASDPTGLWDGILRKLDSSGGLLWQKTVPGNLTNVLADATGVTVVGRIATSGLAGGYLSAAKYDPSGNLLWSIRYRPSEGVDDCKLDPAGNVLITSGLYSSVTTTYDEVLIKLDGGTGNTIFSVPEGLRNIQNYPATASSDSSGNTYALSKTDGGLVLQKHGPSGTLLWSRSSTDTMQALIVDGAGNSYVTSSNYFNVCTVTKYDTNGNVLWTSLLSNSLTGKVYCIFSGAGNVLTAFQVGLTTQLRRVTPTGSVQTIGSANAQMGPGYRHLAVDSFGNVYEAADSSITSPSDALLLKFTPNAFAWSRSELGSGPGFNKGSAVVVDPSGRAVLLATVSNSAPTLQDSRVVAYDATGVRIWGEDYDPHSTSDYLVRAVTDAAGNTYAISSGDPSGADLVRYDVNGNVSWVRPVSSFEESLPFLPSQFAPNGNVIVGLRAVQGASGQIGSIRSYTAAGNLAWQYDLSSSTQWTSDFKVVPDGSVLLLSSVYSGNGQSTILITKLSSTGAVLWSQGGAGPIQFQSTYQLAVDLSGAIYVDFNAVTTSGAVPTVMKFDSNGAFLWAQTLPPTGANGVGRISVDRSGDILVFDTFNAPQGDSSMAITKLDPNGNILWSTPVLAGCPQERELSMVVDSQNNCFTSQWASVNNAWTIRVQKLSPAGVIDWTTDYPMRPDMHWPYLLPDQSGGVAVLSPYEDPISLNYRVFKLSTSGNLSWPSSGGAFTDHSLIFDNQGLDDLPSALTTDAKGNLYVSGASYGPSGTLDAHVIKYWANNDDFVSQNVPTQMDAGETYTLSVSFRNTGFNTWTAAAGYKLAVLGANWGVSSVPFASTDAIAPGATKTFNFRVYAPLTSGVYNIQFQLYNHTIKFGVLSSVVPVTVTLKPDAARFMVQTVPSTVKVGTAFTVTVDMRNVGTNTWTQAAGYTLAPASGYPTWGITGVALSPSDSIAPGQDKVFTFTCLAPPTAGTYNMRWQMFHQGFGYFGDKSFARAISVTP